jgi:lauroyl/myristoyl acyltransferase
MLYRLTLFVQWLARVLPRSLRWGLAGGITQIVYWGWYEKRLATQKNMSVVLGLPRTDPRVRRAARLSWRNYGHYIADFFDLPNHDTSYYLNFFQSSSKWNPNKALDTVETAYKSGRGIMITTAHYGNWDIAGVMVASRFTLHVLAESLPDPKLDELIQQQRCDLGVQVILIEQSLRPFLRLMKENGIMATPIDRPVPPEQGIPITFFGRTAYVPRGLGSLAVRTGSWIIPGYAWYNGLAGYHARAFEPILIEKSGEIQPTLYMQPKSCIMR